MPLSILIPLVVIGLIIGLTAIHLFGGKVVAKIENLDQAETRFLVDFPDANICNSYLSADQKTALLIDDEKKPLGLILALGSKQITRKFDQLKSWKVEFGENELLFKLADLTLPNASYLYKDSSEMTKLTSYFVQNIAELDKS